MQYLVVLSLIAAVASAGYIKPTLVAGEVAEIQEIIAAINSPSTDPATAAALEQLLLQTLGLPQEPSPIAVGPAIVEFPVHDGGAVTAEPAPVVEVSPAAVVPAPAAETSPLVQIIVNVNAASSAAVDASPAAVPAPVPAPVVAADPVQVVEQPSVAVGVPEPVLVVEQPSVAVGVPEPVLVVEQPGVAVGVPEPVLVAPVVIAPEPIQIGEPIIPQPIVLLPDILN